VDGEAARDGEAAWDGEGAEVGGGAVVGRADGDRTELAGREAVASGAAVGIEHAASARQLTPMAASRMTLLIRRRYAAWLCLRRECSEAFLCNTTTTATRADRLEEPAPVGTASTSQSRRGVVTGAAGAVTGAAPASRARWP
jgi:hypothetical protein